MSNNSEPQQAPKPEDLFRIFSRNPKERDLLRKKHLVIVGVGSVGSAIAVMAARAGVGKFTLIDNDDIDPANLDRHMCDLSHLFRSKVFAVAELIGEINPEADVMPIVEDFRNVDRIGIALDSRDGQTLLVAATDSFECQSLVNQLSLEENLPSIYINCWGEAAMGEILYVVPRRTPCFECYAGFRRHTEALSLNDPRKYSNLDFDQTKVPGQAGLWPNILVICGFAFQVILALLGDEARRNRLIDDEHSLLLVNVGDFDSPLQPLAVTPALVEKGCALCDEDKLMELMERER
jgi:hypothetical protein